VSLATRAHRGWHALPPAQRLAMLGHGGTYELGMRERSHGLPVQPFDDP
jgi:hypothetical protein